MASLEDQMEAQGVEDPLTLSHLPDFAADLLNWKLGPAQEPVELVVAIFRTWSDVHLSSIRT